MNTSNLPNIKEARTSDNFNEMLRNDRHDFIAYHFNNITDEEVVNMTFNHKRHAYFYDSFFKWKKYEEKYKPVLFIDWINYKSEKFVITLIIEKVRFIFKSVDNENNKIVFLSSDCKKSYTFSTKDNFKELLIDGEILLKIK